MSGENLLVKIKSWSLKMKFRFRDSIQIAMKVHQSPSPRWSNVPNFPPPHLGVPKLGSSETSLVLEKSNRWKLLGSQRVDRLKVTSFFVVWCFDNIRVFWCNNADFLFLKRKQIIVSWRFLSQESPTLVQTDWTWNGKKSFWKEQLNPSTNH